MIGTRTERAADHPGSDDPAARQQAMRTTQARRVALAIGVPLVAVAVVFTALWVVGLLGRVTVTEQASYPVPAAGQLEISTHGAITVTVADVDAVDVTRTDRYGITAPSSTAETRDGSLVLASSCPWWNIPDCSVAYDVTIPSAVSLDLDTGSGSIRIVGTTAEVRAHTGSGSILAEQATGPLDLDTGSGSVQVHSASGDLSLHSGSGTVTGTDISSTTVTADNGSGRVDLSFSDAPTEVSAHSGSGAVIVEVPAGSGPYQVDATTGSGSRTADVRTDPAAPASITARAGSGSVTVREAH